MVMGKMKMKMKVKDEDEDYYLYQHVDFSNMHHTLINESHAAARMAARPLPRANHYTNIAPVGPLPRERHRYRCEYNAICPMAPLPLRMTPLPRRNVANTGEAAAECMLLARWCFVKQRQKSPTM